MHGEEKFGESPLVAPQPPAQSVAAQSLRFLLECPENTGLLLGSSSKTVPCKEGQMLFRQSDQCAGLYLLVTGQFFRRVERDDIRLSLAPAGPGELVELAAALGDQCHTYSLIARTAARALLLPMDALEQAFGQYPTLRMHLLEELAREVSRAYRAVRLLRMGKAHRVSTA